MTGAPRIGLVRLLAQREGIREIIFAAFAALVYFGIRNLTAGSVGTAYANADRVMRFERATHLVAAFPSLHFGWNVLAAIAVWGATRSVVLRTLGVVGPAAMAAGVVLTANHYVIDVLAGLAVVLVGLAAHGLMLGPRLRS